jgi:hypothetical protein
MVKAKLGKALAKKLSDFIDEMKDKYAMTPDQTKSAIRNYANEGYLPKDPKRMLPGDDEPIALMVTTNTILPSTKKEFMEDIFEQSVKDDILGEARKEVDLFKLKQLDTTKMTKQADGGRVGMVKGGLLKGLASLFKKKKPKKTEMFGPPRDPEVDYETAAALKRSRKLYDLERKNLSPLQEELDKMLKAEQKSLDDSLTKLKIATSEMEEMSKVLDEFNRVADEEGIEEALKVFNDLMNPKRTLNADGGRVGMLSGGLAKGIMQAMRLAARGVKPFGEKQTYKQNVTKLGLANENALLNNFRTKLTGIMDMRQSQVPEEDLLNLFEDIATGKKYDMASPKSKQLMLGATMKGMRMRNIDGSDFQNFMADIGPKIKNRDILPDDVKKLLAEIDEGNAFMEELRGESSSKIIPFLFGKPRKPKKADGGIISDAELADPRYNSATGEYEIGGGVKLGKLELDMLARGAEGFDPTMQYEGSLDLGDDLTLTGGYYDDAIMQPGMMSPEDEIRFSLTKGFKDGGAASINKATLEGIRDMPMRSRAQRIPYVQKMKSDLEKYMREGGMGSLFKEK